ncbi:hypothetical protein MOMA_05606 [Moraxella macacae 0408225]|uniref:Uncharacterized protein n=1 Tax=Moraxella macacae 0408225 TaxID=1230338 RepID=L2F5E8_9GAMM|nr:DUF4105 domain-containing protein [Moraxella macacae]ELA08011.1 hypothetical protein MOMA_05606 [Moraxella macacae 0408225]
MYRTFFLLPFLLALTCFANIGFAHTDLTNSNDLFSDDFNTKTDQALIERLSQHKTWLRLLLYKNHTSEVLSADFFVSPKGKTDAKAELLANLHALQNAKTATDYLCRFPARSNWLMQQIPNLKDSTDKLLGFHECKAVNDWLNTVNATQLSLIHAEEHVSRFASAFGHTLIKVDNPHSLATHDNDLAMFINFAPDNTQKRSKLTTVFNALRGHSPGLMTFDNYAKKQANYLIHDNRDIWQYTLKLSNRDIRQIMRHFWEIKDMDRHYSFLSNNCASEIVRLLDVINPQYNLVGDVGKIIAPAEVSRILTKKDLLSDKQFIPSKRTLIQANQNTLTQHDIDNYAKNAQLNQLPTITPSDNDPATANRLHRINVAVLHKHNNPMFLLGVRGGYQDLLDNPSGKRDFLNLTTMSVNFSYNIDKHNRNNKTVQLYDATLIDMTMFNPKNAGLKTDSSKNKRKTFGGHIKITPIIDGSYRQNNQQANEHRVLSVGGEYGSSWFIGKGKANSGELPNTLCYRLATGQGQIGKINQGFRIGLGVHLGCTHRFNSKLRVLADARLPYWFHGVADNNDRKRNHYFSPIVSLTGQYDIGKQSALRAGITHQQHGQNNTHYLLSYHWFFD